jgi:hypothetical protein
MIVLAETVKDSRNRALWPVALGTGLVLTLVPETVSAQAGERPKTCKGVPPTQPQ